MCVCGGGGGGGGEWRDRKSYSLCKESIVRVRTKAVTLENDTNDTKKNMQFLFCFYCILSIISVYSVVVLDSFQTM